MESTTGNAAPRRARLIKVAVSVLLVLFVLLWLFRSGRFDFRSDTAKIRGVTEDFIEACQDRDFDEIWDLHSAASQEKGISEFRYEMRRAGVSYPKDLDDEDLFLHVLEGWAPSEEPTLNSGPWLWPPEWLADLRIGRVQIGPVASFLNRMGQAEVELSFSGKRYGGFGPWPRPAVPRSPCAPAAVSPAAGM